MGETTVDNSTTSICLPNHGKVAVGAKSQLRRLTDCQSQKTIGVFDAELRTESNIKFSRGIRLRLNESANLHSSSHACVPTTQGFLERLGDEVIAGVELIRAKALALVGMGGGSGGVSSSRSGFEEKQGYYDAGSDLEASGSAVSSKGM